MSISLRCATCTTRLPSAVYGRRCVRFSTGQLTPGWSTARQTGTFPCLDLEETQPDPLTKKEVTALLQACLFTAQAKTMRATWRNRRATALRDKAILFVLLDTGLRATELCNLRLADVNMEQGSLNVRAYGTGRTKRHAGYVPFGHRCKLALWEYLTKERKDEPPIAPLFAARHGQPLNRRGLHQLIQRLGERASIARPVYPHLMRHTFAYHYLMNGGSETMLQKIIRHSTRTSTMRYVKLTENDLASGHQTASPADRWGL